MQFSRRSKAFLKRILIIFAGEITVYLRTLRNIKIKYFSPEPATKAIDFLPPCIMIDVTFTTGERFLRFV